MIHMLSCGALAAASMRKLDLYRARLSISCQREIPKEGGKVAIDLTRIKSRKEEEINACVTQSSVA